MRLKPFFLVLLGLKIRAAVPCTLDHAHHDAIVITIFYSLVGSCFVLLLLRVRACVRIYMHVCVRVCVCVHSNALQYFCGLYYGMLKMWPKICMIFLLVWRTCVRFGRYYSASNFARLYQMMRTNVAGQTVVYWSVNSKKGLFVPSYYDPEDEYCERCEEAGLEECECYLDGDPADLLEQSFVGQSQDDYDGLSAEDIALIEHDVRESITMEDDLEFMRNTYAPISNVTR